MKKKENLKSNIFVVIKKILSFIKPFKGLLTAALLLNVCFSLLSVISISLIKPIFEIIFKETPSTAVSTVNNVIAPIDTTFLESLKDNFYNYISKLILSSDGDLKITLLRFGILIFTVFLVKNIVKYVGGIINYKFEESVVKYIRDTVFEKINSLSIDFFNKNKAGNLISIILNDVAILNSATVNAITVIFRDSFQIIFYILLLFTISTKLTLISFFAGGFILLIVRIAIKFLRRYATRIQQAMADFTSTMTEIISGIRIVKVFNGEEDANNRFKNDTYYYVKSLIKHQKVSSLVPVLSELSAIAALCMVLLQGGTLILDNTLTSSDLMLFLFSVFSVMAPIITVTNCITNFQRGLVSAERIFDLLDKESTIIDGQLTKIKFNHSIELRNVSFKYTENFVLKNINLVIERGQQVAFVGSSGSGKSTMLDLIIRFYDPVEGEILIDGINIKEYDTKTYRSLFGVVSQENILFNDTIRNNIVFGYKNYNEEDLVVAAKTSNSYNFIANTPRGFETFLGDRGVNISGGERQRVAIARALLRKPNILIFDEATSSLDAESERIVQNAINNSLENKTAIIVAHRLSTIINCDLIVVFEKGQIVEQGKHSELMDMNGYYANLYNLQFKHDKS